MLASTQDGRMSGEEKFIEVKATRGNEQTAFYVSVNEVCFSAEHSRQYKLYRLYNFEPATGSAKFYVLDGPLTESCLLSPIQYKAHPNQ